MLKNCGQSAALPVPEEEHHSWEGVSAWILFVGFPKDPILPFLFCIFTLIFLHLEQIFN